MHVRDEFHKTVQEFARRAVRDLDAAVDVDALDEDLRAVGADERGLEREAVLRSGRAAANAGLRIAHVSHAARRAVRFRCAQDHLGRFAQLRRADDDGLVSVDVQRAGVLAGREQDDDGRRRALDGVEDAARARWCERDVLPSGRVGEKVTPLARSDLKIWSGCHNFFFFFSQNLLLFI